MSGCPCSTRAQVPANSGAERLVPPACARSWLYTISAPEFGSASKATSDTPRWVPDHLVCQLDDGRVEVGGEVGIGQGGNVVEDELLDLATGHAEDVLTVDVPLGGVGLVVAGAVRVDGARGDVVEAVEQFEGRQVVARADQQAF